MRPSSSAEANLSAARQRVPSDDQRLVASGATGRLPRRRSASNAAARHSRPAARVPTKLYRMGEVVAYSGLSRQTIHNYTTMGLLRESRWTDGGHRLYDEGVFTRLDQIAKLKSQRKSLEQIRKHFARLDGR
jgi:hypothetical protein